MENLLDFKDIWLVSFLLITIESLVNLRLSLEAKYRSQKEKLLIFIPILEHNSLEDYGIFDKKQQSLIDYHPQTEGNYRKS